MKIENQVCSLELAQKLKSLNVKQESLFYWHEDFEVDNLERCRCGSNHGGNGVDPNFDSTGINIIEKGWKLITHKIISPRQAISAFTCSELGEMLPDGFKMEGHKNHHWLHCKKDTVYEGKNSYLVYYEEYNNPDIISFSADTECDARAKMLVYLLENNLINVEDINK